MATIRVTHPIDPKWNHDCDRMHLESYALEEVMLPVSNRRAPPKAIRIVIRGRNLKAVAQPLTAFVGKIPVQFLRIAPDERSVEGLLLTEPPAGSHVEVFLGEEDAARHPTPLDTARIGRID
jgi:hypothetical protein